MYLRLGDSGYTEAGAKLSFWGKAQDYIDDQLKQWFRQGWQLTEELGPDNIGVRITEYRGRDNKKTWREIIALIGAILAMFLVSIWIPIGALIAWFMILMLLGVLALSLVRYLTTEQVAEPLEFRAQLRRVNVKKAHSTTAIVCPYCRRTNWPDDFICDGCGAPLATTSIID